MYLFVHPLHLFFSILLFFRSFSHCILTCSFQLPYSLFVCFPAVEEGGGERVEGVELSFIDA
jgi:hypothetical protein